MLLVSRPVTQKHALHAPRSLIWVVDDSLTDSQRASRALSSAYDVEIFDDGSSVLERLTSTQPPEALVLDWVMPGVSGIEVIQFLRSNPGITSAIPVLLLTSRSRPEQIIEGLNAGANDYLAKPFEPEELKARVDALLRSAALLLRATEAEKAVRELLSASPDALIAIDARAHIEFVNQEAARIFDLPEQELLGYPVSQFLHSISIERLLDATPETPSHDIVLNERIYAPSARAIPTGKIRAVIALRDVTHRRLLDAKKLDLYSIVAHDLRSPLNAMLLRAQLLADGGRGDVSPAIEAELQKMQKSCGTMVTIINDFLDIAKLDAFASGEKESLDLRDVISDVLNELTPLAEAKSVNLDFNVKLNRLDVVGDRTRLRQVVANLVGNAIKFSPEASNVTIGGAVIGNSIEINVRDQGSGVPVAAQHNIFNRFTRASTHGDVAGSGLGLMIVKQIVEAHSGTVGVESNVGKGSRFWFRLPKPEQREVA